ncbi:MAG TPA: hypothetical protein VFR00_10565 [Hyphomicrobiaceae bacterium]|jgi:hypothetical protein|nr:hypothetical protein [Hyphomicrobiaceae bacterium]
MQRLCLLFFAIAAAAAVGGCGSLPTLGGAPQASAPQPVASPPTAAQTAAPQRTDLPRPGGQSAPFESAFIAEGNPTGLYALIARGALACWLGAGGPLNGTHVFAAEAAPPTQGGTAEIVLHERDRDLRDQRGPRALRIRLERASGGVRVGFTNLRFDGPLAERMARDVASWAKGGTGCGTEAPKPPPIVSAGAGRR